MSRTAVVALCLAAAGFAPGLAQKKDPAPPAPPAPPPAADTVRLRFAWPVGLTARVIAHKSRAQSGDGKSDTTHTRLTYRLTVHPRANGGNGRIVRFHDFEIPGTPALDEIQERLSALMPSIVVDTGGEFVAIEDVEAMRREMDAVMGPVSGRDHLRPETQAMLERLRSPELLNQLAGNEWNALVGAWVSSEMELGITYELESEAAFPLFPGLTLQMIHEFTAVDRVPCTEQDTQKRCVELENYTYPDEASTRALFDRLMADMTFPDTSTTPVIEAYDVETEIRLIAEPATLVPHLLEITKRVTLRLKQGSGPPTEQSQTEAKITRYEYTPSRP